jgi:F420-non-reducing hydrogenase small subunit
MKANMPCRGCFGPPPRVLDQGAKMISAIASIYQGSMNEDVERFVKEVVDPAGTFYRFGMATSLLKKKRSATPAGEKK